MPADKSACQQSHTKKHSQLATACDQSNFRHLSHHYPIRQWSLIKFRHNNSLRWSGQACRPTFIVIPCSVTQSVELQHETDAAVSLLQVAAWCLEVRTALVFQRELDYFPRFCLRVTIKCWCVDYRLNIIINFHPDIMSKSWLRQCFMSLNIL